VLLLFPIWAALAATCLATGALAWWALARALPRWFLVSPRLGQLFWLGFGLLIGELQLFSLFHRIDRHAWALLLTVAGVGLASSGALWRAFRRAARRGRAGVLVARVVGIGFFGVAVALTASLPIQWYDTLSTHLQQAKWAGAFHALPGLANLNPKLGFDQAHHLLAALVDAGPWRHGAAAHVVDGFMLYAALAQGVVVLTRAAPTPQAVSARIFAALTMPFLANKTNTIETASLSGDLAMAAVLLPCTLELMGAPVPRGLHRRRYALALLVAATLGGTVFAIKFSGMMVALAAMTTYLVHLIRGRAWLRGWPAALALVLPAILIIGTIARRVVLTGWPLYPIPHGALPLPWTVPYARTFDQYLWIKSWARLPGVSAREVLDGSFMRWFKPWYDIFRGRHECVLLIASAVGALARTCATPGWIPSVTRTGRVVELAAAASLVYWFVGAPDLRFGGVYFFLLFAAVWTPILAPLHAAPAGRVVVLGTFLSLMSWHGAFDIVPGEQTLTGLAPPLVPAIDLVTLDAGTPGAFKVAVPRAGDDVCGEAPLPCTHYPGIQRLRMPPWLDGGFLAR
jgi:hypothetical protein